MIKIKIIALFPELIKNYLQDAIIAKAVGINKLQVEIINLRDFSDNSYKSVDDTPFGGGDGMLIRADILEKALLSLIGDKLGDKLGEKLSEKQKPQVIYFTPQGQLLEQGLLRNFVQNKMQNNVEVILICGRYAGIDQRFIDTYVDQEISIGDYILSGGELPALVFIEALVRLIPGVLGNALSAEEDSFKDSLLEAPQYTRPQVWHKQKVPEVLLSGNHQKIEEWRKKRALEVTQLKRPELLKKVEKVEKAEKIKNSGENEA